MRKIFAVVLLAFVLIFVSTFDVSAEGGKNRGDVGAGAVHQHQVIDPNPMP